MSENTFNIEFSDSEMSRLQNVSAAAGHKGGIPQTICQMLDDAVGMCMGILTSTHPELAAALARAQENQT